MARSYRELRDRMSPAARAEANVLAQKLREEMALHELRRALQLSQEQLAEILGEKQPSISKIEQRTDMFISTLRRYIRAMGGELEILARFPDGVVRINQFADVERDSGEFAGVR